MDKSQEIEMLLERKKQELDSMKTHYEKDVQWEEGVQDSFHSESYSYDVYSDPVKADKLKKEIEQLEKEKLELPKKQQMEFEEKLNQGAQRFGGGIDAIKSNAKHIYEEKMNAYMNQNFWGKAKMILTGKKMKKMSPMEIMKNYGEEAAQEELQKNKEHIIKQYEREIMNIENYNKNNPNDKISSQVLESKKMELNTKLADLDHQYQMMLEDATKSVGRRGSL